MSDIAFGKGGEDFRQAEWLAYYLRNEWRYDHTAESWHHWDGHRWAPDQTSQVLHRVASLAAQALDPNNSDVPTPVGEQAKAIQTLLNINPQERALKALATFEGYGTNGDDWDAIPYLLGTESGIVDLRKNALIKASPEHLVTKTTGTKFVPVSGPRDFVARAPEFMHAMDQWMSEDTDMVGFLLLWFGASLFGFTPEQRFLLMTGIGRNGKGALKHSILRAVGEYGLQADANLYMRSKFGAARSDQARADLLAVKGKRITFFSEPEGNRFNEEMLKAHTGGDMITARALHSNNVQNWAPTHSITFLVNNAPEVEDLGPSMAARVMVADFRERYDGDKEDKRLYGKLEKEADGILAILCWAAKRWFDGWDAGDGGITLPERVIEQSKAFMERNDPVANWLADRCTEDRRYEVASGLAYESFLNWFSKADVPGEAMSQVRFALELQKKGFTKEKTRLGIRWTGFKLLGAMELAERGDDDDE